MTRAPEDSAHEATQSVGALIIAGIVGAAVVLVIFGYAAANFARHQQLEAPARIEWSIAPAPADSSVQPVDSGNASDAEDRPSDVQAAALRGE